MNKQPHITNPPDPQINIRPVYIEDVTALCPLWPDRSQDDVYRLVSRALQQQHQKRGLGVIIIVNKKLAGYGQFTLWGRTAEISDLAILEEHRGYGFGTALIQHLIKIARQKYATYAEIGVAENNPRAMALYRRLGFEPHAQINMGIGENKETIIYLQLALR